MATGARTLRSVATRRLRVVNEQDERYSRRLGSRIAEGLRTVFMRPEEDRALDGWQANVETGRATGVRC